MIRQDPWFFPVDHAAGIGDLTGDSLVDSFTTPAGVGSFDGRRCMSLSQNGPAGRATVNLETSASAFSIGMRCGGGGSAVDNPLILFLNGGTIVGGVWAFPGSVYRLYRGNQAALLGQSVSLSSISVLNYIEVDLNVDGVAGDFALRINGVVEASGSGLNTGTGPVTTIQYAVGGNFGTTWFRDGYFYRRPGAGTHFLGPLLILHQLPTSDAGPNDGTPSAGAQHFALVDEAQASSADYIDLITLGHKERFGKQALASTYNVIATGVVGVADNVASGSDKLTPALTIAGVDYPGAPRAPGDISYKGFQHSWTANPATAAPWTPADWNAAVIGVDAS